MANTEAIIVSQYTSVVGALDQMFTEMDLRSEEGKAIPPEYKYFPQYYKP